MYTHLSCSHSFYPFNYIGLFMPTHKLSLRSAILINLNIMVGFGLFVNTVLLAKLTGSLGFLSYGLTAVFIAPLIISIAALMKRHHGGGFYAYSAHDIHPFVGYISAWGYFTGKLASAALIIHVVMTLLQSLIPVLATVPTLVLDSGVILLFAFLNTFHMKLGSQLASFFFVLKLTPILFAVLGGLFLISTTPATFTPLLWSGIPLSIPFVLYTFIGFEAACSLSQSIENPSVNGPRAIYISFALAVALNIVYQFLFFAATQGALMTQTNYLDAFPVLLSYLMPASPLLAQKIVGLLYLALACATLGASYGILLSVHWNLYTLAQHKHIPFARFFTKLNAHNIPTACVVAEALLCGAYLIFTGGDQKPLQQISVLGTIIAYTLSIIGLFMFEYRTKIKARTYLALICSFIFLGMCLKNFFTFGLTSLFIFLTIQALGIVLYIAASTNLKGHQRN